MVIVDTNCLQTFLRFSYSSDTSVLMYRLVFMTENNDSNDAFKSVFGGGGGCDIFPLNFSNLDCVYSASLTKPFHDLTSLHNLLSTPVLFLVSGLIGFDHVTNQV